MSRTREDPREAATRNFKRQAESSLKRVPATFKDEAQRFYNRLRASKVSWATSYAQMQLVHHYAEGLRELAVERFADATQEDIEAYLAGLEEAGTTTANRVVILKKLHWFLESGKGKGRRKVYPEKVDWLDPKTYTNGENGPLDPTKHDYYRNGLSYATKLVASCDHPRDRAIVMTMYDSGGRLSEIAGLRVRDISTKENYAEAALRGKTGERTVSVARCVPYLLTWLNHHPDPSPDAPLWVSRQSPSEVVPLGQAGISRVVRKASARCELDPSLTPHDLRHAAATERAMFGFNEEEMRARFGWSKGSKMPSHYTHLLATDSTRKELALAGVEVEEAGEAATVKLVPQECPTCGQKQLPSDARFCYSCGKALTTNLVEEAKKQALADVRRMLLEDPDALESLAQEVAKVMKRGYAINENQKDADGLPHADNL